MKNKNLRSKQLAKGIALSLLLGTSLYINPIAYAAVASTTLRLSSRRTRPDERSSA